MFGRSIGAVLDGYRIGTIRIAGTSLQSMTSDIFVACPTRPVWA
jgi:hypothetical protein